MGVTCDRLNSSLIIHIDFTNFSSVRMDNLGVYLFHQFFFHQFSMDNFAAHQFHQFFSSVFSMVNSAVHQFF